MKTVVITGITGKSGKYFLENLIENADRFKDYYFKVSVRETSDTTLLDSTTLKYEKCYGDLKDYNYLNKLCTNIDTLLHIAGIHFSPLLVDAAISNGVKRMILVHTTGIYSKYKWSSIIKVQSESERNMV